MGYGIGNDDVNDNDTHTDVHVPGNTLFAFSYALSAYSQQDSSMLVPVVPLDTLTISLPLDSVASKNKNSSEAIKKRKPKKTTQSITSDIAYNAKDSIVLIGKIFI